MQEIQLKHSVNRPFLRNVFNARDGEMGLTTPWNIEDQVSFYGKLSILQPILLTISLSCNFLLIVAVPVYRSNLTCEPFLFFQSFWALVHYLSFPTGFFLTPVLP